MSKSNPDLFLYQRLSGKYPEIFRAFEEVARAFKLLPPSVADGLKGAWDAGTTYKIGDTITYGGSTYIAVAASQGRTPSATSDYWTVLAQGVTDAAFDGITLIKTAVASAGETIVTAGVTDAAGRVYLKNISTTDANFAAQWSAVATGAASRPWTIQGEGSLNTDDGTVAGIRLDTRLSGGGQPTLAPLVEVASDGERVAYFSPTSDVGTACLVFDGDILSYPQVGSTPYPSGTRIVFDDAAPAGGENSPSMGIESGAVWVALGSTTDKFHIYSQGTSRAYIDGSGNIRCDAYIYPGDNGPKIMSGSGSPEGVETAAIGSIFMRTDGGAGTSMYVKESGTGNTGWVAK